MSFALRRRTFLGISGSRVGVLFPFLGLLALSGHKALELWEVDLELVAFSGTPLLGNLKSNRWER